MTGSAPCDVWPAIWPCDVTSESPAATGTATQVATEILWALSGRQFGECTLTLRPCRRTCYMRGWFATQPGLTQWQGGPVPVLSQGLWFNLTCGDCSGGCSCKQVEKVLLPGPVISIEEVKINGSPIVTGAYVLYNSRELVRVDGGVWPICNDLGSPDTEPDTWSVTAKLGVPVPESAKLAVGELACEVLKALRGQDCRLPRKITQLARQGVTISMPDLATQLKDGLLGLYLCDMFIKSTNPKGLAQRSRVYSIDHPRGARQSWP